MLVGAFGRVRDADALATVRCTACGGCAERLSSVWYGEDGTYHNYQCRAEDCPAGGTIIDHGNDDKRHVGPVFGDCDLAVRLATRDHSDLPAEAEEVRA